MRKSYYIFPDRAWKACGTIEIDPQADDVEMIGHLKSLGYLGADVDPSEIQVLRPKVGDVVILQYRGNLVVELCAA